MDLFSLLLIGSIFVAFASGVATIWSRWVAAATFVLFFLAYISAVACVIVWYITTNPSCGVEQHVECKVAAIIVLFGGIWLIFLLMAMRFGSLVASLVRWR
jgi:hypothetical protein